MIKSEVNIAKLYFKDIDIIEVSSQVLTVLCGAYIINKVNISLKLVIFHLEYSEIFSLVHSKKIFCYDKSLI